MNALILLTMATVPVPGPISHPGSWISYPPAAMRNAEEGEVGYVLEVDAAGKPFDCRISASSGFPTLDAETCRMILLRARFHPAKDAAGKPVASRYAGKVNYSLAE